MKTSLRLIQAGCLLAILHIWIAKAVAQLTWVTNSGTITITGGCPSSPGAIVIPETINGLPVTSIDNGAFGGCINLTSLVIPNSVTSIGLVSFADCPNLSTVKLSEALQHIPPGAFADCASLTTVTIPSSVDMIFGQICGGSVGAFEGCPLTAVYFEGNAPTVAFTDAFTSTNMTAYYLPGTSGWGLTFADRPTAQWFLPEPVILKSTSGIDLQANSFGFRLSWATNSTVVVEVSHSLSEPQWSPISTNALVYGRTDFRDSKWADHDQRFYRVRRP